MNSNALHSCAAAHARIPEMAGSAWAPSQASDFPTARETPRHAVTIRVAHWIVTLCFFLLLWTGLEIVVSHPRFYWGETGNILTSPLFVIPIPASRSSILSGYSFSMPDANGWGRYLHFQTAWLLVLTGLIYFCYGIASGHFRRNLLPPARDLSPAALGRTIRAHWRFERPPEPEAWSYNVLQRLAYLGVIFVLFPLVVWTGLAMSPAFVSAFPSSVTLLGGQQSARTLHFLVSISLVLFLLVHVLMIFLAGFRRRMRAMITGRVVEPS